MKIYIASHKLCLLPSDKIYRPLFVGAAQLPKKDRIPEWSYDDGYTDSISQKNRFFCELTGTHWIWKQSNEDIKGLVHYRRFLGHPTSGKLRYDTRLTESEIRDYLTRFDCLVARREYLPVNNQLASVAYHYRFLHSSNDLQQTYLALKKVHPEYLEAFNAVMKSTSFIPCNILIANKALFDAYAQWLFSILTELERRIDPINYRNTYQQRVFGFIAERLLSVYIEYNKLHALECNLLSDENEIIGRGESTAAPCLELSIAKELPKPIVGGIDYSRVFNTSFYLSHYRDIADYYRDNPSDSIHHYLAIGVNEGHVAHPLFSLRSYMNGNPELRARFGDDPMNFVLYYLKHPWKRSHILGFENMHVESNATLLDQSGNPLKAYKKLRYALNSRIAESIPLID